MLYVSVLLQLLRLGNIIHWSQIQKLILNSHDTSNFIFMNYITYLYSVETDPIDEVFKQEICEMSLLYACLIHLLLSLSQRQSFWSKIANK